MSVVFRVGDVPAASRVDYWRHVVDDKIVPMDVRFDDDVELRNQMVVGDIGAVQVTDIEDGSGEAVRTRKHIRRSDPELYQILVQVRGHVLAEQDGRVARLGPGDLGLCDLSRPFRCVHTARRFVCVKFPKTLLPLRPTEVAQLTGVRVPGDRGSGSLASSLVRRLPRHLDEGDGVEGARLGAAVLDLLTVALAARLDRGDGVPGDTVRRALLTRVHAFIEERLGDPELTPGMVAEAHHISVRYLYKLFEPQGDSVAGWIRRRRLDRCRRDLLDPGLRGRTVGAIAARWGFSNAPHFSRAFRAAYGVTPVEYRTMGNGSDQAP